MSIQVRTTFRQDGAFSAKSQGPGLPVASGARCRPGLQGKSFANVLGERTSFAQQSSMDEAGSGGMKPLARRLDEGDLRNPTDAADGQEGLGAELEEMVDESSSILDPLHRAMAGGGEWKMPAALEPKTEPLAATARVSLEQVVEQLVRKIAWSGNMRAGVMRVEIGEGALSGASLLVQADGAELRVTLDLPAGADAAGWRERIEKRLTNKGLRVTDFEVR